MMYSIEFELVLILEKFNLEYLQVCYRRNRNNNLILENWHSNNWVYGDKEISKELQSLAQLDGDLPREQKVFIFEASPPKNAHERLGLKLELQKRGYRIEPTK